MLKSVKIEESVLLRLKEKSGGSYSSTISTLLGEKHGGTESLMEQISMRFDYLEQMVSDIKVGGLPVQEEVNLSLGSETKQEKFFRLKKEAEAQEKARRYAIEHPEECDQTREYM